MKVLLLDPHDVSAQELRDLSCSINEATIVSADEIDPWPGTSPISGVDVVVGGVDIAKRRSLIDSLLMWRTHRHTSLVPCWIGMRFDALKLGCLWPPLSVDRFNEKLVPIELCDWLCEVAEWYQTRMHFSSSASFYKHSPLELVSSFSLRNATGRLAVFDNDGEEGFVYVQEGRLVDARIRHLTGYEAFFEFLAWSSGSYMWEASKPVENSPQQQPLQTMIEEGLKLINDANIVFNFVPDLYSRIEKTESQAALDDGASNFFLAEKQIYSLINGATSVWDLVHASPLSIPRTLRCLAKWFSLGDIKKSAQEPVSFQRLSDSLAHQLEDEPAPLDFQVVPPEGGDSLQALEVSSNAAVEDSEGFDLFEEEDVNMTGLEDLLASIDATAAEIIGGVEELVAGQAKGGLGIVEVEASAPVEPEADLPVEETLLDRPPENPVRLLIVDDSRFMCIALQSMFSKDPRFQIVGVGHDGLEALKLIGQLQPDVVTLDMQMPRMDGLTALKHIMIRDPKPIVVLSAFTRETSQLTYESFKYGAIDVLTKPDRGSLQQQGTEAGRICDRVADAAGVRLEAAQYIRRGRRGKKEENRAQYQIDINQIEKNDRSLLVICCGMGGFPALLKFLFSISELDSLPPIVACISMPERAVEALVPNLHRDCDMEVEMISTEAGLRAGACFVYSHEHCCHVSVDNGQIKLEKDESDDDHRPFDRLLRSVGDSCGEQAIALLLSGTGNDGLEGMRSIRAKGGMTFVLSPESCLKPDLPRSVLHDGLAAEVKGPMELVSLLRNRPRAQAKADGYGPA